MLEDSSQISVIRALNLGFALKIAKIKKVGQKTSRAADGPEL